MTEPETLDRRALRRALREALRCEDLEAVAELECALSGDDVAPGVARTLQQEKS